MFQTRYDLVRVEQGIQCRYDPADGPAAPAKEGSLGGMDNSGMRGSRSRFTKRNISEVPDVLGHENSTFRLRDGENDLVGLLNKIGAFFYCMHIVAAAP